MLAVLVVATAGLGARGDEKLDALEARMDELQDELDATTERIEELRTEQDVVRERIASIELEIDRLEDRTSKLGDDAEERAVALYKQGPAGMFEALIAAQDFSELLERVDLAERVSARSNAIFYRLARDQEELTALGEELEQRRTELADTTTDLEAAAEELQDKFAEVSDEYEELKKELAAARREAAREAAATTTAPSGGPAPTGGSVPAPSGGGKVCPVNGPVSFVDSWGAPRDGHTHVGVDMMADYGTPLVAIVSGTVSSGWDDSGGNMIFLSGDDGNSYWYLHNETNIVTSGRVSAGQQIGTVGDTGNAVGIPHLHFEYHPGGGGPVNPYPLVASIC